MTAWQLIRLLLIAVPAATGFQILGVKLSIGVVAIVAASFFASAILDDYMDVKGR